MIKRHIRTPQNKPAIKHPPSNANKLFDTPEDYTNKQRPLLRDNYSGEWWLNVDYVEHPHSSS